MPFIVQIVIAIVMAVASYYISARANKQSQSTGQKAGTIDTPTVDAGRSIPVVFGRVRIKSPNLTWMGGQRTTEIKK